MDLLQWLTDTELGAMVSTVLVSMVPVLELRFGIPWGVAHGLSHWTAFLCAVLGNMIPLPFIVVYIRRIFKWMRRHLPQLDRVVDKLEAKAHLKGRKVTKYRYLGLMIFVAIPLPGTGGWTGALIAAFLDMRLRKAMPSILAGILIAGFLITGITYGFTSIF
ncbi:small multi-drug export protein [Intestinimonas sp.]|uniref:COG2426 family protein n=1 Tax=Intestinimonas sp. TaxID=1965293 RepID=UPI002943C3D0|nr:small multi-drug export protein [uncultured Intestinimonas sp.]